MLWTLSVCVCDEFLFIYYLGTKSRTKYFSLLLKDVCYELFVKGKSKLVCNGSMLIGVSLAGR